MASLLLMLTMAKRVSLGTTSFYGLLRQRFLVIAILPLPYAYYTFLRLFVCAASAYLAYHCCPINSRPTSSRLAEGSAGPGPIIDPTNAPPRIPTTTGANSRQSTSLFTVVRPRLTKP